MLFPALFWILAGALFGGATIGAGCSKSIRREFEAEPHGQTHQDELLSDRMSYKDFFASRTELTKAFCDSAKSYIQISSATLALPLLFTQAMLGKAAAESGLEAFDLRVPWLVLAWLSFLSAIGFGLFYQWLPVRRLWDQLHKDHITDANKDRWGFKRTPGIPQFNWLNRSILYGGMVASFFLGAIFFVLFAFGVIFHGQSPPAHEATVYNINLTPRTCTMKRRTAIQSHRVQSGLPKEVGQHSTGVDTNYRVGTRAAKKGRC